MLMQLRADAMLMHTCMQPYLQPMRAHACIFCSSAPFLRPPSSLLSSIFIFRTVLLSKHICHLPAMAAEPSLPAFQTRLPPPIQVTSPSRLSEPRISADLIDLSCITSPGHSNPASPPSAFQPSPSPFPSARPSPNASSSEVGQAALQMPQCGGRMLGCVQGH